VTAEMVANWAVEFKKFSVEGSVDLICIQREVASLHATDHLRRLVSVDAPDHSVVVVSYEGLHAHGHVMHGTDGVDLLIADEAHRLRNLGSMAASFLHVPLRRLRGGRLASSRLLLTGTPLPNNIHEFAHLMDIALPGVLGDNVTEDVVRPIAAGLKQGASRIELAEAEMLSEYLAEVSQRVHAASDAKLVCISSNYLQR